MSEAVAIDLDLNDTKTTATGPLEKPAKGKATEPAKRNCKASVVMLTEVGPNEVVQDEIFGLRILQADFDPATKTFTIKAQIPTEIAVPVSGPESGWTQIVTQRNGHQVLTRRTNMVVEMERSKK